MTIISDSSKFEKKFTQALEACKNPCSKTNCKKCPFEGTCTIDTAQELKDKFVKGLIVWSKGELVEKESVDEVFELVFNEETNQFDVFPDIYEGDEIIQSTIFRGICDVFLDNQGAETDNHNDNHMVKIPKIHYEMNKKDRNISITVSRKEVGRALAHTRPDTLEVRDNLYISKYLLDESFESRADTMPVSNLSLDSANEGIRKRYDNPHYQMIGFHQLTLLQILYLLRFKTLDSRSALGFGVTDAPSKQMSKKPKAFFWGNDSGKDSVSLCGINDFYGNLYTSIAYVETDDKDVIVYKGTKLEARTKAFFGSGKLEKTYGTTEFGFIPIFD